MNESTSATSSLAIIGMAGRFPSSPTLQEWWRNLAAGRELTRFFTEDELLEQGIDAATIRADNYVPAAAVLEDEDRFDAAFFGMNPKEADITDPQLRVFLECSHQALEDAGYGAAAYRPRTGVFGGCSINNYLLHNLATNPAVVESLGGFQLLFRNEKDHLPTFVSYKLNLHGPSVNVQTACSTSLVAVHMACQSVLSGECDMALAGGASVRVPQRQGYYYQPDAISSPDGRCRVFDEQARGTVSGNGVGAILIRRLDDAIAARDRIHAVILGSAINNDGSRKAGYTAPSVQGETEAVLEALAVAQADPASIGCVEAHGTGTRLGDPIEIEALTDAFRAFTDRKAYCAIGSLKSNMGHLDAAAGIAGVLKMVLQLENRSIAPSLHYRRPNPQIDFESSPFVVSTSLHEWRQEGDAPRRGGVSSFGIGGTNSHVILEEAPASDSESDAASRPEELITLSAKSPEALRELCREFAGLLRETPGLHLPDAAYTLHVGREALDHRLSLVSGDAADLREQLDSAAAPRAIERAPEIAFLFPGQGSQHVHMLHGLYKSEPAYRETFNECAAFLLDKEGIDLASAVYPAERSDQAEAALRSTELAQPALFAVEYAAACLWLSWGVKPSALAGHSIGEYTAACLASVFSLEEALHLVAARGRLMATAPPGSMLAVSTDVDRLRPFLADGVGLAAVNGPQLCVVSGPSAAVATCERSLHRDGIQTTRLHTSHAFHSPLMDGILDAYAREASKVRFQPPAIPILSNVSGVWLDPTSVTSADYWVRQIRETVLFGQEISELLSLSSRVLLEVGPSQALTAIARRQLQPQSAPRVFPTAPHARSTVRDERQIQETLGNLWELGVGVDWQRYHAHENRRRISLPTYPFQRRRHWIEPGEPRPSTTAAGPAMQPLDDWFYAHSWKRAPAPVAASELGGQTWLLLVDQRKTWEPLSRAVEQRGGTVVTAAAGEAFGPSEHGGYRIDPTSVDSYSALFDALEANGRRPNVIVHLWSLDSPSLESGEYENSRFGFFSLLSLGQAVGARGHDWRPCIGIATDALFRIMGGDRVRPDKSLLLGPARVFPAELEGVQCRVVDVGGEGSRGDRLAETLIAELTADADSKTTVHAYRQGERWTPHYEPIRSKAGAQPPLRKNGVYLITGGLGGIGLALARYLAEQWQARLVLVGRTGLPPRSAWDEAARASEKASTQIARVRELEALGAEVEIGAADVSDREAMQAVYDKAIARFGALHGVVHAAGVAGGGLLQLKSADQANAVLSPKTEGARVLADLVAAANPDFVLLCSSITALLGGAGQVDYCAGNAYLDAFACELRRTTGVPAIAVNWDPWKEVGMAFEAKLPAGLEHLREQNLRFAMTTSDGVEAFQRVLASGLEQVVVSTTDLQSRLEAQAERPQESDDRVQSSSRPAGDSAASAAPRPVRQPLTPPRDDLDRVVASVWQESLGIDQIGIEDDFFELGGHSLLAIQINSKIRELLGAEVSLASFFQTNTVAGLSDLMRAEQAVPGQLEQIAETVLTVASMSPEEVETALAADAAATREG